MGGEAAELIYFPKDRKRSERFCQGYENGTAAPVLRCHPSVRVNACAMLSSWDGAPRSQGPSSVFSLSIFPLLNSSMKEHQDLYSVFLKLCSVLFDICPGLDNWGVLLFFLLYVIRLQYFSSFLMLLMNFYLKNEGCSL